MACCATMPAPSAGLVQIRQGFRTLWEGLTLSVETEDARWTCRIADAAGRPLYTAARSNRPAAVSAALEFAAFQSGRSAVPEHLSWSEYW